MEEEKIIWEPSGDQDGELLVPLNLGKETGLPVSMEYMQICALVTRIMGLKQVKATREASGDHRGVSAMERRVVIGC